METLTFDSYSTVVDVDSALDEHLPNDVPTTQLSNLWRAHSITYTLVANHLDTYDTFYEVNHY